MDKEQILRYIDRARRIITLKREISSAVRRELPQSDFVFPETRSFPIQRPEDVRAAVRSWGRANAVRARGFTFEDFQRRLTRIAKRNGSEFVAALPAAWEASDKGANGSPSNIYAHGDGGLLSPSGLGRKRKATRIGSFLRRQREQREMTLAQAAARMPIAADTIANIESGDIETPSVPVLRGFARLYGVSFERLRGMLDEDAMPREAVARNATTARKNFSVFKDATGQYRWLMVSSSAYVDRDNEIVSEKALRSAVAEHDASGARGPLRWWHVPGLDLGTTDFGMMHGRMLVESGTFHDERVGAAVAKAANDLSASIGFKHPQSEPSDGVFNTISIFERSILPREKASNLFASLQVKGSDHMSSDKIKEFITLVGADEAARYLGDIEQSDKAATQAGFAYKETSELAAMNADELLEYSLLLKEHEEAEQLKANGSGGGAGAPMRREDDDERPRRREDANADLLSRLNKMMSILEEHGKQIKALQGSSAKKETDTDGVAALDDRLKALEGEQPRAVQAGYRATQQGAPVEDPEVEAIDEKEKAWRQAIEDNPQIAPFADTAKAFGTAATAGHPYWGAPGPNGLPQDAPAPAK